MRRVLLYNSGMRKRSSRPGDVNQLAANIVDAATSPRDENNVEQAENTKNPAAVALGRLGGKKGGPARAKKLTPEQRKEIAKKAAEARWNPKGS